MRPSRDRASWYTRIGAAVLALGVCLGGAAQGQDEGGESKGRPLDGYFGGLVLTALCLFAVGKTARR